MAELSIELLGSPRVRVQERLLSVDTKKAVALLAYLAMTEQAFSRDTIAALLWPEYDQDRARASLRRTLSALRTGLGTLCDALEIDKDQIRLRHTNEDAVHVDVDRFKALIATRELHGHGSGDVCGACLKPLTDAVALYRGDFLPGFSVRDCPEFEEWQRYQTEFLKRALGTALEQLVTIAGSLGRHPDAIAAAHRRLSLDTLHEPAHRHLMLAYARAGERSAALQQYRLCARMLDDELGVAPLPETTELAELIRSNRALPPPILGARSSRSEHGSVTTAEPDIARTPKAPLVGRGREWHSLMNAYAGATRHGCLVVLEGEPGIGKTRLAEEFIAQIRARGAIVLVGHCYEGESDLAYGVSGDAIRAALQDPRTSDRLQWVPANWLAEAARLLPELAQYRPDLPQPVVDENSAGARLVEGLRQVIVELLHGQVPGILFVDDLQWADDASLELLQHVIRHFRDCSLLVLATWRDEEGPCSGRLRRLVADARRSGTATVLPLERLELEHIAELVSTHGRASEIAPDVAVRLYEQTEGLPLFVVMCLEALTDKSTTLDAMTVGMRDLLRARVEVLSETARQLLGAASVVGHSFDFDTLRETSGRTEDETDTALDELLSRRMVREADAGSAGVRFDFTHEQLRKTMYEDMSVVRRGLLHRRVAEALRAGSGSRSPAEPEPGEIAMHYRLGRQDHLAAEYYVRAGERAQRLHANAEALAHFEAALALGYSDTIRLHEAIGDLHTLSGAYGRAASSYDLAAVRASPERLVVLERKLGSLCVRQGAWECAESHFRAALSQGNQIDVAECAHLLAAWSLGAYRQADLERAWRLASEALQTAELADESRALAECHNIAGMLARHRGDLVTAELHLERSLQLATANGDLSGRVAALNNLSLLNAATGHPRRGLELLDDALEVCKLLGDHHQQAALLTNSADMLRATGDLSGAVARMKEAAAILAEIGAELGSLQPEIWKLSEW